MDDLISRQAVIDAVNAYLMLSQISRTIQDSTSLQEVIGRVPSARSKVIRCNSCKYWSQSTGKMKGYGLGRCDFHDADLVTYNGFCYWAERRTDG